MLTYFLIITGIGLGLTASLLERPNSTVIATVRDKEVTDCSSLRALPLAENSKLVIETLCASTSPPTSGSDSGLAVEQALLAALTNIHGIKHIDTIIANAGTGTMFSPILNSSPESLLSNFSVNTLSPIFLFQTLHPLLSLSKSPKYIAITSMLGSISLQSPQAGPTLAYGISKAGLNFFVRKLHFEIPELVALAIHPGYVLIYLPLNSNRLASDAAI
jgi:norsolorinic acid ketoreductase